MSDELTLCGIRMTQETGDFSGEAQGVKVRLGKFHWGPVPEWVAVIEAEEFGLRLQAESYERDKAMTRLEKLVVEHMTRRASQQKHLEVFWKSSQETTPTT